MDLKMLRCPKCASDDSPMAEKSSYDGLLACARCGYIVPVIRGVPRFVSESVDAGFDERWRRYPKFQATTAGIFEEKTGFSKAMLGGKTVLDAGCGCGRFAAVAQGMGAKVIGVDGSAHALLAATENVSGAEFLQANILALPLRDESVDHAFSIGVLHHTESTERAFKEVARTVRRGGSFAVWVYAKPASDDRWLAPMEMLHEITRSVPPRVLSEIFAKWAPKIRDGYAGGWGALEQVLRVSSSRDAEECASDTFDWHCPTYRWWHGAEEVKRWFIEAGFDVDRVGNFPTSVRGVRVR